MGGGNTQWHTKDFAESISHLHFGSPPPPSPRRLQGIKGVALWLLQFHSNAFYHFSLCADNFQD